MNEKLMKLLEGKHFPYDFTLEEIKRKTSFNRVMIWGYVIASLVVMLVGANTLLPIADALMSMDTNGSTKLILLFGLFGMINFFLLLWVWLTNESSYYKMEQRFMELMYYLRDREFGGKK